MTRTTSPSRAPSAPVAAGILARLITIGETLRRANRRGGLRRWGVRLLAVVAAVIVLWLLFVVAVQIITSHLWFESVHHGSVYTTMIESQVLLFCVFGAVGGLVGGLTAWMLRRMRAPLPVSADDDTFRWIFRKYESRFGRIIVLLAVIVPGILVGSRASRGWQTYQLWRHAKPWHTTDPLFHKDVSFFVEIYPFHAMVVALLTQAVGYGLLIAVFGGYWYGAWRLRRGSRKLTATMTRLMSLLLAVYLVLKAANYWLSRYALTTSPRGLVTGASYTDVNAALPSKYVLMIVALLSAVVLLANAVLADGTRVVGRVRVLGRVRGAVAALLVVAVTSAVAGYAWPALVYRYREAPSAARLDLNEIAHNQQATLAAYGLEGDVDTVSYNPAATQSGPALVQLAGRTAQISLIDPNELSPTFNVAQQLQAYYGFESTLDQANYDIDGRSQDVAVAVRELQPAGIPHPSWVNTHLVYTHGYGIVAAPTTRVDPQTESPVFLDGGLPPGQQIPVSRPEVYFSPALGSSSYAIVGQPAGSKTQLEFDHPGSNGSPKSAHTTYQGNGGIPIGSTLRRLLFAVQLHSSNIFFSSELNRASQLLTVRDPRARVAKVAPWLTLDGDVYPAVVSGHIQWIVDGYTTSANYPNAQLVNLHTASTTTLTANGASIAQASRSVNYLQNSVKAVVDAYTGKVTLYAWNQKAHPDPLLRTWESVFPGLIEPQSKISPALLRQLRYPTDLFNVQRYLLARYHVTQPSNFFSGNDFWTVPVDPTVAASNTINAGSAQVSSSPSYPSKYMSMSADGLGAQHFSLSSPMVTLNGQQLAAFLYVNSEPGPGYGKFTVLQFPTASGAGESPSQVQNDIESDTAITEALTLQRGGNSKVVLGGLEAIPVGARILYVEPVYTQSGNSGSFPILRHVIALYANGDPSFEDDLQKAVSEAILSATGGG